MYKLNLSKKRALSTLILSTNIYFTSLFANITVTGIGIQEISPNIASFTAIIETKAQTAKQASSDNAAQTDKTIKLLKSLVTNPQAITTQGYSLYPEYQYNRQTNNSEFAGFKAQNTIVIKTDNTQQVGELLDKTIASGVSKVDNLVFSYDAPEQIYQQALSKAIYNAKQRAEVLAKASELKLKNVADIKVMSYEYSPPSPIMAKMTMAESAVSTPIEAADVKTKAIVEVVFESE